MDDETSKSLEGASADDSVVVQQEEEELADEVQLLDCQTIDGETIVVTEETLVGSEPADGTLLVDAETTVVYIEDEPEVADSGAGTRKSKRQVKATNKFLRDEEILRILIAQAEQIGQYLSAGVRYPASIFGILKKGRGV